MDDINPKGKDGSLELRGDKAEFSSEMCIAKPTQWYELDIEKVKTIDDIKVLLEAMQISFTNTHPAFDNIEKYLKPKE